MSNYYYRTTTICLLRSRPHSLDRYVERTFDTAEAADRYASTHAMSNAELRIVEGSLKVGDSVSPDTLTHPILREGNA